MTLRFFLTFGESGREQKAQTQQIKFSVTKHLPLDELEAVDMAFNGSVALRAGKGLANHMEIAVKRIYETDKRGETGVSGRSNLGSELLRLTSAKSVGKGLRQANSGVDLGIQLRDRPKSSVRSKAA
jgi:hypothetical protein